MTLAVFASTARATEPNYLALQHPRLTDLFTVLVCPMRPNLERKVFRTEVKWGGTRYVVATELARPVNRGGLRYFGEMDAESSHQVMTAFLSLLNDEG